MNNSLVSIIVPCYNQAQYLDEALQSVSDQTYFNWECIIVNDGSRDNTEKIALDWSKIDDRFIYIKKENGGLSSARNAGIEIAKGNYFQFLDSDDVLHKKKIELSITQSNFQENDNKDIVITNFRMFTDNPFISTIPFCTLLPDLFNFKSVLLKWESVFSIPIHCGLFGMELFKNFRFPEELRAKEDWVMWLYLFQKGSNVYFIDKTLVYYRLHEKSMTTNPKLMMENHTKAIVYLKDIVSDKDYNDYLFLQLKQKIEENVILRTTINNFKNSNNFKIAEKIKKLFFVKYFFKIIKK